MNHQYLIVCKTHCAFYKEGKEVLLCGALRFLSENYNITEISGLPEDYKPDYTYDRWILKRVCKRCDFYPQDCGFRSGDNTPPCGGYIVLEALRKQLP